MLKKSNGHHIIYFGLIWVIFNLFLQVFLLKDSEQFNILLLDKALSFQVLRTFYINCFYYIFLNLVVFSTCAGVIALIPLILNRINTPQFLSSGICIFLFSLTTIYFVLDTYVFQNYDFHITLQLLDIFSHIHTKNLLISDIKNHLSISNREFFLFLIGSGTLFIVFGGLLICAKKMQQKRPITYYLHEIYIMLTILFFCLVIHMIENFKNQESTLIHAMNQNVILQSGYKILRHFHIISKDKNLHSLPCQTIHSSRKMYFPPLKKQPALQTPNILWIVIDTLRYDAITPELTPAINQFAQENIQFVNHQSSGNPTLSGVFGMLFGLPSNYFSSSVLYHSEPLLFKMLRMAGYDNHVFFSGTLQNPPFIKNAFYNFSKKNIHLYPFEKDGNEDEKTISQLQRFLKKKHEHPFFSFTMLNSVHNYCLPQNYNKIYKMQEFNRFQFSSPLIKNVLMPRYNNAVHHMDSLLTKIFETLQQKHLNDNTIVILTSDHGENFNDYNNSLWGHSNSYTPSLLHVPLLIHIPHHLKQTVRYQTTHYDIPTTLLKIIFNFTQKDKEYMIGQDLFTKSPSPFFLAGSYVTMAIVTPQKYYIIDSDGDFKFFNQRAEALPIQQINREYFYEALHLMSKFYLHEI